MRRGPRVPPIDNEEVRRMHAAGTPVVEMIRKLGPGVGRNRINRVLDELGLPRFLPGTHKPGKVRPGKAKTPQPLVVSIGDRFEHWTVTGEIYRKPKRTPMGHHYAVSMIACQCDCGVVADISAWNLLHNKTTGCKNCIASDRAKRRYYPSGADHPGYLPPSQHRKFKKEAWLLEEKSRPCVDCGQCYPHYCMEFDHIPERGNKLFMLNLGVCGTRRTLDELKAEREKCDLVCSICHNCRTWERGKYPRGDTGEGVPRTGAKKKKV